MLPSQIQSSEPQVLSIRRVVDETSTAKTLFFSSMAGQAVRPPGSPLLDLSSYQPGQFVMVWIPRVDEKPYAVSYLDEEEFGITVMKRGRFSSLLHMLKRGDKLGFRGPYGRGFSPLKNPTRTILAGGGCGMASLASLADEYEDVSMLQGARTASELFYTQRYPVMTLCTEDGSCGHHGYPTDLLKTYLDEGRYDLVCSCGPERMLAKVLELCEFYHVQCEISLERYMKCGFGVCGQCDCDGKLVCLDGPVFTRDALKAMPSFGKFTRLPTGRRVRIDDPSACETEPRDPDAAEDAE